MSLSTSSLAESDTSCHEGEIDHAHNAENDLFLLEEQVHQTNYTDAQDSDRYTVQPHQRSIDTERLAHPPKLDVASDQQNTVGSGMVRGGQVLSTDDPMPSRPINSLLNGAAFQSSGSKLLHPSLQGTSASSTDYHNTLQTNQNSNVTSLAPSSETLSSPKFLYSDNTKPPAPSSVKSYGSNLGSEDCGGSLDVEAQHSDDARSIDEVFPVSLPDHDDPENVAVALLSIDPAENSSGCNQFDIRYKDSHGHITPLTLHHFHQTSVHKVDWATNSQLTHDNVESCQVAANNIYHTDTAANSKVYAHWNDPRIDNSSSHRPRRTADFTLSSMKEQGKSSRRSRSRSRSRSPLKED
jgi:hypothetical protein